MEIIQETSEFFGIADKDGEFPSLSAMADLLPLILLCCDFLPGTDTGGSRL